MIKTLGAVSLMVFLAGCEQAYRYPCQDPANWNAPECQRPLCEVNRDCPDLIFKDNPNIEIPKTQEPAPASAKPAPTLKGECK
jgi:hypothetical protein